MTSFSTNAEVGHHEGWPIHCRRSRSRKRSRGLAGVPTAPAAALATALLLVILLILAFFPLPQSRRFAQLNSLLPRLTLASAEEIVATGEWMELGPNDTIPAGLHVRMDMSTGKKWVKKLEEEEMTDFDRERLGVPVTDVEVGADGTATVLEGEVASESRGVAVVASLSLEEEAGEDEGGGRGVETEEEYDYLMMHRTLSSLPPDEQARMGGLPELPPGLGTPKISPQDREMFEGRLREIWEARQQLLREVQEKHVADLAKVIVERIKILADYLEDPVGKRTQMLETRVLGGEEEDGAADVGGEGHESAVISDILAALEDLEYSLSDVDMARDFHTLGGWPVAVSLLSSSVHCPPTPLQDGTVGSADALANETSASGATRSCMEELADPSSETRALVDKIQSHAAWVLGTAVKNHEEFHDWALEDLSHLLVSSPASREEEQRQRQPVTAISLLLSDFLSDEAAAPMTPARKSRRQKGLYAVGSMVRGNRPALLHLHSLGGISALSDLMARSLDSGDVRFASKVSALGYDLLTDVRLHPTDEGDEVLAEALTARPWCDAAAKLAGPVGGSLPIREKGLEAVGALAERCGYGKGERDAVARARAKWLGDGENGSDHLDPAYRNDLVAVADAALAAMDQAAGGR